MKKKLIFLLLILTGIIPFACCPDPGEGPYSLNLSQIIPLNESFVHTQPPHDIDYFLSPDTTYTEDTLILRLDFSYILAQNSINFSLQPSAFAWSCDEGPYPTELKDKMKDISVTSDKNFDDVQAGEKLNDKIISFNEGYDTSVSLEQMVILINSLNGYELMNRREITTLAIIEKPTDAQQRTFRVTIEYESGRQEVVESFPLIW